MSIFTLMEHTFLNSGFIERYCYKELSEAEAAEVEATAAAYPKVNSEIEKTKSTLNAEKQTKSISKVKYTLMREVYKSSSLKDASFLPLLSQETPAPFLQNFLVENNINPASPLPAENDVNLIELKSTVEIQNAAVWIQGIFPEEIHYTEDEYIFVLKGSCRMKLNDVETDYVAGEVIFIPPFVTHSAIITSSEPMFALVQRQLLPAV